MRESIQARLENEIKAFFADSSVQVPGRLSRNLAKRITNLFVFNEDEDETWYDIVSLPGNLILRTHAATVCAGEICCIHNPSDHHMSGWDQEWQPRLQMMMRVCDHDQVHPDPDDLVARRQMTPFSHSCDGCCDPDGTVQVA